MIFGSLISLVPDDYYVCGVSSVWRSWFLVWCDDIKISKSVYI